MAKFIPSLEEIESNKMEQPTEGEWTLLQELKGLNDNYTIYFQPHINIKHPDIVITAKGCGVMIIEVKDWNLGAYEFTPSPKFGIMREKRGHHEIKNPFEQVQEYKDELYNVLCPALFLGNLENKKVYGLICPAVFYYKATEMEVKSFFNQHENEWNHIMFWGNNSENILSDIKKRLRRNILFTNDMYSQITALFRPSLEIIEQAEPFDLSKKQQELAISISNEKKKIKGAAGSGKTLVLAQRAVNCFKRTRTPVLILTFNITLPHYIRDKISQITRDVFPNPKKQFDIIPIFDFVKQMLEINNIPYDKEPYDKIVPKILIKKRFQRLEEYKDRIYTKYNSILIDEVQDFEYYWLKMIEKLFLRKEGEFVLFGDEKQNIYHRELDTNQLPQTPILGRWKELNESYRLTQKNVELALQFQKEFFSDKYRDISITYVQQNMMDILTGQKTMYCDISNSGSDMTLKKMIKVIEHFRINEQISPNDICILSSNHGTLRELEFIFRKEKKFNTTVVCETKEEYEKVCKLTKDLSKEEAKKEKKKLLDKYRRMKKHVFEMNAGVMKLCTIHSFKGWEINTIFLILDDKDNGDIENNDELIYTAITRAKKNLIIINNKNDRYKSFFERNLGISRIGG